MAAMAMVSEEDEHGGKDPAPLSSRADMPR